MMHALRGQGLLQGIELRHPATGERFDGGLGISARLAAEARGRELMIYSSPAPVVNRTMDAVLLAPPLIITDEELDMVVERLEASVDAVERALGSA